MKTITFDDLRSAIKHKIDISYMSVLWLSDGELKLDGWSRDSHFSFRDVTISMDESGIILSTNYPHLFQELIGTRVDLRTCRSRLVYNEYNPLGRTNIIGKIDDNGLLAQNSQSSPDKWEFETIKDVVDVDIYKKLTERYRGSISEWKISYESGSYRHSYKITLSNGVFVKIKLIDVLGSYRVKAHFFKNGIMCAFLQDEGVAEYWDRTLKEIENGLSLFNKVHLELVLDTDVLQFDIDETSKDLINAKVWFWNQKIIGTSTRYDFTFTNTEVSCTNGKRSRKFIPKKVKDFMFKVYNIKSYDSRNMEELK